MNSFSKDDLKLSFTEDTFTLKKEHKYSNTDSKYRTKLKTDTFFVENKSNNEYIGLTILTLTAILLITIFFGIKIVNPNIDTTESNFETTMDIEKVDLIVK